MCFSNAGHIRPFSHRSLVLEMCVDDAEKGDKMWVCPQACPADCVMGVRWGGGKGGGRSQAQGHQEVEPNSVAMCLGVAKLWPMGQI